MAINNSIFGSTETEWGWSLESTFGTAIADTGNFEKPEGEIPSIADRGIIRYHQVLNDGSRVPQDVNMYHSEVGGVRIIPFSNLRLRRKDLAVLLYGCIQVMDEGETPEFTKVLTVDNTVTQPLFGADAGLFMTIGINDVIANYHQKFTSCIVKNLTLTCQMFGGDGLLYASGEFISGFPSDTTANFNTGTWLFNTQNYINFGMPTTKQIGGADIVLYGFDLTFNNNAVRFGSNATGGAEGYALATNRDGWSVTGNLRTKYDAIVQGIIAADIAGTGAKIQLATGTPAAIGHVDFTMNECFYNGPAKEYAAEEGQLINVPFMAAEDSGGSNALLVATISDAEDRAWPT